MKRSIAAGAGALLVMVGAWNVSSGAVPTWVYDPDTGNMPNDAGQPFASPGYQFGSNSFRSIVNLGGSDNVLQVNTADPDSNGSIGWENDAPNPNWNVDVSTGYSVEWRIRLDPIVATGPSAAAVFAGAPTNWTFMRMYNTNGYLQAEVQSADGNAGGQVKNLGNPFGWHTYRLDVKDIAGTPTAKLYVDNYFQPVVTKALVAGGAHAMWFGDGTGTDDGKYQVDYVKTWQSGIEGAPAAPSVTALSNTRFLAHYDGNTAQSGLTADYARGNATAIGTGGVISGTAKFPAGSLDGTTASGTVNYDTADNFDSTRGTVEMWVRPDNWSDGAYSGFFSAYNSGNSDIRLQKTSSGQLQAYMAAGGSAWDVTSAPLALSNDWHHIAWTWDLDLSIAALYVDGVVVDNSIASSFAGGIAGFTGTVNPTFEIGTVQGGTASFPGLIDEFRISDRDLYGGVNFTPQNAPYNVPEPASLGLLAVAALMAARRRRPNH